MNQICMRFPNGKSKALTLSYDDGMKQDIRLLELLTQYKVKGTFNINSGTFAPEGTVFPKDQIYSRLTAKQSVELYSSPYAEVAVHGLTHPYLERLTPAMMMTQVVQDRINLEKLFGGIVCGMAYPYGTYNDEVVNVMRAAGIAYARTIQSHHTFDIPKDWLRMGATCRHRDPELMNLAKKFLDGKPDCDPYLFYLWGHSFEFDVDNNWNVIEDFLKLVSNNDDVWYATNMEIYNYVQAYKRLIFSVDGTCVFNPSNISVWCKCNHNIMKIQAGKYVSIG